MEIAAIALQQVTNQANAALAMIRQNAQAEQAVAKVIAQASASGGRGQHVDLTV